MPKLKYKLKKIDTPVYFRETGQTLDIPTFEYENDVRHNIENWIKENCEQPAKILTIPDYDYTGEDEIIVWFDSKEDMLLFKLKYE